jgi:8-hydroxy-5-deazaflavin:NADPH oxidoreductase
VQIAVLGTGVVGRTLAEAFAAQGHDVVMGTRDVAATLARTDPGDRAGQSVAEWSRAHPGITLLSIPDAGQHGDVVVNATSGEGSLAALHGAGSLDGKVVVDVSNALDFSSGFPPTLFVANTDSLGEQIQRAFPGARVVKALNTVTAAVMAEPSLVPGEHHVFMAGEDPQAKELVAGLLAELGWPPGSVLDLGGIRAARSTEMYVALWLSLMGHLGTPVFNVRVVPPT